jgi:membrane protease YdiL (CAAX protease family)
MIKKDTALAVLAGLMFLLLFAIPGAGPFDFWWRMSGAVLLVGGLCVGLDKDYRSLLTADLGAALPRKVFLGSISGVLLYLVFFGLDLLAPHVFPPAPADIGRVYALKAGASPARVALLLVFLIGPGEEIIWRGYLQRHWESRWGFPRGWLLTAALYAAVHLGSDNPMLTLAAAAAGLFWGLLYHRYHSVLLNAVSHTLWDVLIFLLVPLSS